MNNSKCKQHTYTQHNITETANNKAIHLLQYKQKFTNLPSHPTLSYLETTPIYF